LTVAGLALAAACASGSGYTAPAPPAAVPARDSAPPRAVSAPSTIRLGPSALRYVVARHIHRSFSGQSLDIALHVYLGALIVGPADTAGYPTTITVDSVTADSGTFLPPAFNLAGARGLRFTGHLAASGDFRDAVASDTVVAANLSTLIGNFRDFFPRVPAGGLAPDAKWTDTTSVTDQGAGSSVTVTSLNHTSVGRWADRDGTRCLELDVQSTFTLSGNGQQNGQNFTLAGSGVRNGVDYVSVDGRYVGGTAGDSTSYTVSLQALGQVVPVVQTTQTTIVVIR